MWIDWLIWWNRMKAWVEWTWFELGMWSTDGGKVLVLVLMVQIMVAIWDNYKRWVWTCSVWSCNGIELWFCSDLVDCEWNRTKLDKVFLNLMQLNHADSLLNMITYLIIFYELFNMNHVKTRALLVCCIRKFQKMNMPKYINWFTGANMVKWTIFDPCIHSLQVNSPPVDIMGTRKQTSENKKGAIWNKDLNSTLCHT